MADLTPNEKRFIAAYVTTARRDAYMASVHAGFGLSREAAQALLATPAVREEVERLSMRAQCIDGEVVDVKPLHPLSPGCPEKPAGVARRDLLEELRGAVRAASQNGVTDEPRPPERKPQIITDAGKIAGSAKEVYDRVQRAKRVSAHAPDPEPRDGLEQRLVRAQAADGETTVEDRGDGALYAYAGNKIATPFQIKQFFTATMNGETTVDISIRLQAAALLAKAYGMFDAKTIEREKNLDKLTPSSVKDIRAKIEETRTRLRQLKAHDDGNDP